MVDVPRGDSRRTAPPAWGSRDHDAAAQEFGAGSHPIGRSLVLRADSGDRMLVVAVDPRRQGRLDELFSRLAQPGTVAFTGTSSWRVLRGPGAGRPLAIRLDVAIERPWRCRVHLLCSAQNELIVRHAPGCTHVCLVTEDAFSEFQRHGRTGRPAIVVPAPPTADLPNALAHR